MLKAELIGNIGQDAVIKEIKGKQYIAFSAAHTEKRKDANGTIVERTQWVSVLKGVGENSSLATYLKRGTKVYVRGNLYAKTYKNQYGDTGLDLSILADEVELCSVKKQDQQPQGQSPAQMPQQQQPNENNADGDDLPF